MIDRVIEKVMLNGQAYYTAENSKITINKNGSKVDDFTLNQSSDKTINITVPTNSDYVDLTSAQNVGGVKTFTSAPVVPSKTTDATNSGTAVATESQVYKKQDALTLPSTPTSGHLVTWGANNKTLADGGAIPTGFEPGNTGTVGQVIMKTASGYEWKDEVGQVYTAGTNIDITNNVISATDTTYSEVSKSDMDTGTATTAGVVSAKSIADYVEGKVSGVYNVKGSKATYSDLPASGNKKGDVWNVVAEFTLDGKKYPAGTNVVWTGTEWDPLGGTVDLSGYVDTSTNQSIGGTKTFTSEPVLPSKTSAATNSGTKPSTEAQVYTVAQAVSTLDGNVVKTSGNQTIAGTKTFSTSPVVPSKTSDATNSGTAVATEAQVYKKQDKLTAGTNITISSNTISAKGDMAYADFNWATKSGATITLDLNSTITPSANFTVNAPETIKEGQEYMLRVNNGATVYTMTLGTNITNPRSESLALSQNATDQFKFIGVGGKLELQPEVVTSVNNKSGVVVLNADDIDDTSTTNKFVTATDKTNWNAKADTSDIGNGTITFKQGISNTAIGTMTANQSSNGTITFHDNVPVTADEYTALPSSKNSDGNTYIQYREISA